MQAHRCNHRSAVPERDLQEARATEGNGAARGTGASHRAGTSSRHPHFPLLPVPLPRGNCPTVSATYRLCSEEPTVASLLSPECIHSPSPGLPNSSYLPPSSLTTLSNNTTKTCSSSIHSVLSGSSPCNPPEPQVPVYRRPLTGVTFPAQCLTVHELNH